MRGVPQSGFAPRFCAEFLAITRRGIGGYRTTDDTNNNPRRGAPLGSVLAGRGGWGQRRGSRPTVFEKAKNNLRHYSDTTMRFFAYARDEPCKHFGQQYCLIEINDFSSVPAIFCSRVDEARCVKSFGFVYVDIGGRFRRILFTSDIQSVEGVPPSF
jgi:hypothetical protein